jgi:hypothetical protein
MNDIEVIYDEITESGNYIIEKSIEKEDLKAYAICDHEGDCLVVMDKYKLDSFAEHKSAALHEQGHCETHTFYNEQTSPIMRGKLERRADKYVAENKITKYDIVKANKREGLVEIWEFAEHFGVTVEYMKRLMWIHFQMEFME